MNGENAQTVDPIVAKAFVTKLPERILVVDDDPLVRQLITNSLAQAGYLVDAAADGALAWEALQVRSYDLLITDNQMPKVSGIELVKRLRGKSSALPVVMATGLSPERELERYPELAIRAILIKPFTIEQILSTARMALRQPPDANMNTNLELPSQLMLM